MKYLKRIGIFVFVFLSCWLLQFGSVNATVDTQDMITAPSVINADLKNPHVRWGRPIIVGVTSKETEVYVYIDGKFSGLAKINESKTETNNFYYQPTTPLNPGEHKIYTIARDKETKAFSGRSVEKIVSVSALVAPTVYKPNEDTKTGNNKPLISGLTKSGTRVLIYIDGVYNGKTEIVNHKTETAGFVYKPFLHLSVGTHKYYAISETANGFKSAPSRVVTFNIEKKFPAPTLISFSGENKPRLTGLAKNNSKIQVYLDKKLQGEFKVINHESGTANFYFNFKQPLTKGQHIVYAVAIDQRGKESIWSNTKTVYTAGIVKRTPTITKKAATETVVVEKKDIIVEKKIDSVEVPKAEQVTTDVNNKDVKVATTTNNDILNKILSTTTPELKASGTGLVDAEGNSQSKLKMNLVVFVLFLLALVAWIFWVNRELIKEKEMRENSDDDRINKN